MSIVNCYPNNFEEKIGFEQIRDLISKNCTTFLGTTIIQSIKPSCDLLYIENRLKQVNEWMQLIAQEAPIPNQTVVHWPQLEKRAQTLGAFLDAEEFLQISVLLQIASTQLSFLQKNREQFPALAASCEGLMPQPQIIKAIQAVVDDNGKMRPNASSELLQISRKINQAEHEARKKTESLFKQARDQGYAAETGITIRDGRLVLAILAEHKRKIKGLIHDESATGQTIYIEPTEVLGLNNAIRQLMIDFNKEVKRILIALTDILRPSIGELAKLHYHLGFMDALFAIAKWSTKVGASVPKLTLQPKVFLQSAFHPLLFLHHQQIKKEVIPFSVSLLPKTRILVISGPNAGGKSVTLKAIILLVYLAQCGIPITAYANSEVGLFNQFFIDIGDQQSIENDLSTYSSHLQSMRYFVENANAKTLLGIDEFGMGTDPQLGGPIAEAILEQLHQKDAMGVINTHFSNLKIAAENLPNCFNGAMGFDSQTLNPRYTLETGRPGSSYAFEIAAKIGLPNYILENAKSKLTENRVSFEEMLVSLENEKVELATNKMLVQKKDELLATLIERYQTQEDNLKTRKSEIINKARQEAKQLVQSANRRIEEAIRNIQQSKADTEANKAARLEIEELRKELKTTEEVVSTIIKNAPKLGEFEVRIGANAQIINTQTHGKIEAIKGKKALLSSNSIRMWVNVSDLEAVSNQKETIYSQVQTGQLIGQKILEFNSKLDLRGTRATEAMHLVMRFIDEAVLLNVPEVQILHGKGDGILRKLIREYLQPLQVVKSLKSEHPDRGGDGITLVQLD